MPFHKPAICSALAFYNLTRVTGSYFILWDSVTMPERPIKTLKCSMSLTDKTWTDRYGPLQSAEMWLKSTLCWWNTVHKHDRKLQTQERKVTCSSLPLLLSEQFQGLLHQTCTFRQISRRISPKCLNQRNDRLLNFFSGVLVGNRTSKRCL